MTHWGVALAAGANINIGMDDTCRDQAVAAIKEAVRLAAEQKGPPLITQQEIDYVQALEMRYLHADKATIPLDAEYRVAMERLIAKDKYPDDPNVLTLYADSVMELRPWGLYDVAARPAIDTEEMVKKLEDAIAKEKRHLGANHYYIHAVEPSLTPERAREAADRLASLFPQGGHIQHMPGHIYMRQGLYDKVVTNNLEAIKADQEYLKVCPGPKCLALYTGHYLSHNILFLVAGHTMLGQETPATGNADSLRTIAEKFVDDQPGLERYMTAGIFTRATFHRWDQLPTRQPADKYPLALAVWHWGKGMAFAAQGNVIDAEGVVTLSIDPEQAPATAAAFTNDILPKIRSAPGLVAGYWVDPVEGRGLAFVVFDTEENARRSVPRSADWSAPGVTIHGVELRRVAVRV